MNEINILDFPGEIITSIFSFCQPRDIISLSVVNRYFYEISKDERIWKNRCNYNGWGQTDIDKGSWKNTAIRNFPFSIKDKCVTKTDLGNIYCFTKPEIEQIPFSSKKGLYRRNTIMNLYPLSRINYMIENCIGSEVIEKRKKLKKERSLKRKGTVINNMIIRMKRLIYILSESNFSFSKNKIFSEDEILSYEKKVHNPFSQASLKYYYFEFIFNNKYCEHTILEKYIGRRWLKENTSYPSKKEQFKNLPEGKHLFSHKNQMNKNRIVYDIPEESFRIDPLYDYDEDIRIQAVEEWIENNPSRSEIVLPICIWHYFSLIIGASIDTDNEDDEYE